MNACLAMANLWVYGNSVDHTATVAHLAFRLMLIPPMGRFGWHSEPRQRNVEFGMERVKIIARLLESL
jgi:hypothetical protein